MNNFGNWGWTGVDLFFVLSVYPNWRPKLFSPKLARDQPIDYGESFDFKRSLRILPCLLLSILVILFYHPSFHRT